MDLYQMIGLVLMAIGLVLLAWFIRDTYIGKMKKRRSK